MNTHTVEGFIEERLDRGNDITPEMFELKFGKISSESFYERYELTIWLVIVTAAAFALKLLFADNSELLWDLSTRVMEYLP